MIPILKHCTDCKRELIITVKGDLVCNHCNKIIESILIGDDYA